MEIVRRFVNVLVFIFLVATSVGVLAVPLRLNRNGDLLGKTLPGNRDGWIGTGTSIFVLALVFAVTHTTRRKREQFLVYEKEGGPVSISTQAIADYLAKLGSEFPAVVRMRPKVFTSGNDVDIIVDLKVKGGPQIHEACEMLQKRVRETLSTGLGINEVRHVEINVREIYPDSKPA